MLGGDFSVINPAFFFSGHKKKSVYKVFLIKNLLEFRQLKKEKVLFYPKSRGYALSQMSVFYDSFLYIYLIFFSKLLELTNSLKKCKMLPYSSKKCVFT